MASDWHEGGMAWHGMAWSGMAWHRLYYTYKEILNALNSKGRCKDVILLTSPQRWLFFGIL